MKNETNVCPQLVAEALGAFTVDDLFTINCTIASMINQRIAVIRKQSKEGCRASDLAAGQVERTVDVAELTRKAEFPPPPKRGQGEIVKTFRDCEPAEIESAVAVLQRMAAGKRMATGQHKPKAG